MTTKAYTAYTRTTWLKVKTIPPLSLPLPRGKRFPKDTNRTNQSKLEESLTSRTDKQLIIRINQIQDHFRTNQS
ncbi:MAG TPA: hypothetical protein VJL56_05305 [Candidatus Bathyarchaeia archaeon]|nr:hypothetical protein [Candidatus Bathyarchaeia archaeon]